MAHNQNPEASKSQFAVRILTCLTSYERYAYLRNAVESLLEYFPFGDVLVIDNGSQNPELNQYLDVLEQRNIMVWRRKWTGDLDPHRPGLVEGLKMAAAFAEKQNYEFIQFVEDDCQYIWRDVSLPEKIEAIFSQCPDAVQVFPMFPSLLDPASDPQVYEPVANLGCYRHKTRSWGMIGISPVSLFKKHQFVPQEESKNIQFWDSKGFRVYYINMPVLGWIPWPASYRSGNLHGRLFPPVNKYYLKPLSNTQISTLVTRPMSAPPLAEAYCRPWGWASLTPMSFVPWGSAEYARRIAGAWKRRRFVFPRWTGVGFPRYIVPSLPSVCFGLIAQLGKLGIRQLPLALRKK